MTRPGDRLREFAARSCGDDTMARLIDPLIADLQAEHAEALRRGRIWRSRQVRLAGYIAFVKVFAVCEWSPVDDRRPLIRVAGFSLGVAALVTAALVGIPYGTWLPGAPRQSGPWWAWAVLTLLPQALVTSVPLGLMIGSAIGLAGHKVSARLATAMFVMALICSIGSVANIGWLTPNANQAFRTMVFQTSSPPAKGRNELTFVEFDRLIEQRQAVFADSDEWNSVTGLRIEYHTRWALAFATCVLTMFALSLVGCTRRRWKIAAGVVAALFGYYALLYIGRLFALTYALAPPAAAWLPNVALVLLSATLQDRSESRS